jgi:hypothetical protein
VEPVEQVVLVFDELLDLVGQDHIGQVESAVLVVVVVLLVGGTGLMGWVQMELTIELEVVHGLRL